MQDLNALMGRSCDWVRAYLHNPNSGVREEDRGLCDGIWSPPAPLSSYPLVRAFLTKREET